MYFQKYEYDTFLNLSNTAGGAKVKDNYVSITDRNITNYFVVLKYI